MIGQSYLDKTVFTLRALPLLPIPKGDTVSGAGLYSINVIKYKPIWEHPNGPYSWKNMYSRPAKPL